MYLLKKSIFGLTLAYLFIVSLQCIECNKSSKIDQINYSLKEVRDHICANYEHHNILYEWKKQPNSKRKLRNKKKRGKHKKNGHQDRNLIISHEKVNIIDKKQTCMCKYINLKGLPKSGTTWAINILRHIQHHMCVKRKLKDVAICDEGWRVGSYDRHILNLPHEIKNERLMPHFTSHDDYLDHLRDERFCTLTIFRDPRDRFISYIHWNNRLKETKMEEKAIFDMVNNRVKGKIGYMKSMVEYVNYWKVFRHKELSQPMKYYNIFYEDLMNKPYESIEQLVRWIGYYHHQSENDNTEPLITSDDIYAILNKTHVKTNQKSVSTFRKGKTCSFAEELSRENVKLMNCQSVEHFPEELREKFNVTCAFDCVN